MSEQDAIARLLSQFLGKPRLAAFVSAFAKPIDELTANIKSIISNVAVGVTLDKLGAIVLEYRGDLDDEQYRAIILGKILALRSDGTPEDIRAVVAAAISASVTDVAIWEGPTACFVVQANAGLPTLPWLRIKLLIDVARPAGVGSQLYFPGEDTTTFRLSDNDENLTGVAATIGGVLADNDLSLTGVAATVGNKLGGNV